MATQSSRRPGLSFTVIGIVLAVIGFGIVLLISSLNSGGAKAPAAVAADQMDVLVAASDISFREAMAPNLVKVAKYSKADVPYLVYTKPAEVKNLVAAVAIKTGQPIASTMLVSSGDIIGPQPSFLPLPSGYVAITIPTGEMQGVAGFIQAGDYISVIAVVPTKGLTTQTSRTVFTNLHVLQIGTATGTTGSAPAPAPAGASGAGTAAPPSTAKSGGISSSLTVVVTQCQAEFLTWFIKNASILYTLESFKDYQPQDSKPDPSCASVTAARGVSENDVRVRWPGLL